MNFKAFITVIDQELQIRLGRSEDSFNGSVTKTLVRDKVSVGLTNDLVPVFVRVENAQADARIEAIRNKVVHGQELVEADKTILFAFATVKMRETYDRYIAKFSRNVADNDNAIEQSVERRFARYMDEFKHAIEAKPTREIPVKLETVSAAAA